MLGSDESIGGGKKSLEAFNKSVQWTKLPIEKREEYNNRAYAIRDSLQNIKTSGSSNEEFTTVISMLEGKDRDVAIASQLKIIRDAQRALGIWLI